MREVRQLVSSSEGASRRIGKTLMSAPIQPPREACEGEYGSKQGTEGRNGGKRRWNQAGKEHQKTNFIKEGQANCGKQMKSRVRHLV